MLSARAASVALLVSAAVFSPGSSNAQRLPTNVELKAAYCVKVTQVMIAVTEAIVPQNLQIEASKTANLKLQQERLNKLKHYIEPLLSSLDPVALVAAMKRGETDAADYLQKAEAITDKCATSCGVFSAAAGEARDKANQCYADCTNSDQLYGRVISCNKLDWLPF